MPLVNLVGPGSRLYTQAEEGGDRLVGDEHWASDETAENFGFTGAYFYADGGMDGTEVSHTYTATGGPANLPYVRSTIADVATVPAEFGATWPINPSVPTVGYNDTVYLRFSARVIGHFNQTQKFLQWNTLAGGQRVVIVLQPWDDGYVWRICEDGGLWAQTGAGGLTIEDHDWHNVQMEVHFASGAAATDGYVRIWVDNDDYENPDAETLNISDIIPDLAAGTMDWMGYHQGNVDANLPRTWDWSHLRVAPTFDTNWHASGS